MIIAENRQVTMMILAGWAAAPPIRGDELRGKASVVPPRGCVVGLEP